MLKNDLTDKNNKFLFSILLFYAVNALYIIPYKTVPHAKIFVPLYVFILLLQFLSNKIKINRLDLFLIISILLCCLINISVRRVIDAFFIIILLLVCRQLQSLSRKYLTFIYFYSLISIVLQLALHRNDLELATLSISDPNFSGFYMLLFFFFCFKNDFKLGMLLALSSIFLFLSRAYALSLCIFFLILIFEKFNFIPFKKVRHFLLKRFFIIIIITANALLLGLGSYLLKRSDFVTLEGRKLWRFLTVNDESNLARFTANERLLDLLKENLNITLWGLPEQTEEYLASLLETTIAHNSLLSLIVFRGLIFCIFYFLALGIIIKRLYNQENLKYILSLICFALFLHIGYSGVPLVFFILTLAIPEVKKKKVRIITEYSQSYPT